jgi:site-specific recombinase XerD
MARSRTGSVRERPTVYFAQVTFIDKQGEKQKEEREASSQKNAQTLMKQLLRELAQFGGVTIIRQHVREKRGGIFARVTYTDERGKRRELERRANNRTQAKELIKQMLRDLDDHGENLLDAERMTFSDLAGYYEKNYLLKPEYIDGRKVAGLRSYDSVKSRLEVLKNHFGRHKIRAITHGDLKRFRALRLKTSTKRGTHRSITSVNRELEVMRRMLNIAERNGWIKRNPFEMGDTLITHSDEKKRERILTREEEARLLAACTDKREHIRPVIVCALDTGMRKSEILKLVASDLDFDNRIITVRAFNTKTMRERQVAMTERLAQVLEAICNKLPEREHPAADCTTYRCPTSPRSSLSAPSAMGATTYHPTSSAGGHQ